MGKCSAPMCLNATYKKTPGISFHRFPKDETLKKAWLNNMNEENWQPSSTSVLCSKHFEPHLIDSSGFRTVLVHGAIPTIFDPSPADYPSQEQMIDFKYIEESLTSTVSSYQPNMSHKSSTNRLVHEHLSIDEPLTSMAPPYQPSMFHDICEQPSTSKGIKRSFHGMPVLRELQNIQNIANPLQSAQPGTSNLLFKEKDTHRVQLLQDVVISPGTFIIEPNTSSIVPHVECKQASQAATSSTKELRARLYKNQEEINKLKSKLSIQSKKIKLLKQQNRRLKSKVTKFSDIIKQLRDKEKMNQDDLLILSGIDVQNKDLFGRFVKKAKGSTIEKTYSPELRAFALQLNFYSPRAYRFVRDKFNTILPHPVTLARWYKKVDAEPGFTAEVFDTLEVLVKNYDNKILVNMSIDEMAIRKGLVWDGSINKYKGYVDTGSNVTDDSLPLATQALVVLITAINFNWILPVGYFFVSSLSGEQRANIVKMAIEMLHKIKIYVCGLTFDGAASNISMASNLGCNFNLNVLKPNFNLDNMKIHVFYDPCHMIKLIRNTFGEFEVLIDKDGNTIHFKYLRLLLILQTEKGLHLGNKLKQAHIMFSKQKMKVSLATQLLSKSVADALSLCEENFEDFNGCKPTIKFINIINDLFDILNSRSTLAPGYKKALCKANFQLTKQLVEQGIDYIMHLKLSNGNLVIHSARKTGFVGFIVCLNSALNLFKDLVTNEKFRFLPTYKMSQDFLEMFFGKMRSRGGFNDNPNVVQFRSAYKKNVISMKMKMQKDGLNIPNPILTVSSSTDKCIQTVNITTPSFEKNIMELCDLDEDNLNCFFDKIISNPLDEYTSYVTVYIAGFLARKIMKVVNCKICQLLMLGEKEHFLCSLIYKKDRGGLIYPSKGLIDVVQCCEKFLKIFKGKNINYNTMILYVADSFSSSKELKYNNDHDTNHLYLLIKIIVKFYIDLRAKHDAKQSNISERNYLKKMILFKNK